MRTVSSLPCWLPNSCEIYAVPLIDVAPFAEELYDHRGETLKDFTHQETVNLVHKPGLDATRKAMQDQLISFIRKEVIFRGPFKGR